MHPIALIVIFNFLTLGISYTGLDPRWTGLQPFTWFAVLSSTACLLLGQFCASYYTQSHRLSNQLRLPQDKPWLKWEGWDWHLYFKVTLLAFGLLILGLAYRSTLTGGIPILQSGQDHMTRAGSIDMGILNIYLFRGPAIFAFVLLGAYKKINPYTWIRWSCLILAIATVTLSFMFFQSRSNVILCVIVVAFYHHYFVKPLGFKHFLILFALNLGIFILVATIRMQYLGESDHDGLLKILSLPYLYIANNWWNMDYALNPLPGIHYSDIRWGYGLIEGIGHLFPGGTAFQVALGWDGIFNESIEKFHGLNTVTWHYTAYNEFGYLGLTLAPFIFGVLAEYGFSSFKRNPKPELIVAMSICSGYFILSWFEESYQNGLYVWRVVFVYFTLKLAYRSRLWSARTPKDA